ncbi:MAG: site-specific integrase [Acidobacteriaceae bacterium]|nr:site-specific integrase [Acidobacteriaceae bacterium]
MARQDDSFKKPSLRVHLKERKAPHWYYVDKGLSLGYAKGATGASWIARLYTPKGKHWQVLGLADDIQSADGEHVLSFAQAISKASKLFEDEDARVSGRSRKPYTVSDACDTWLKTQTGTTGKTHVENHIRPALGHIVVNKLRKSTVYDWHQELGKKPPLWATKGESGTWKVKKTFDINDPETRRQRQDTANRVLRTLQAILNLAYKNERVKSNTAWSTVEPFKKTDKKRTDFLTPDEAKRFIEVCDDDFRNLVIGALATGNRYSELGAMKVSAYDSYRSCVDVFQSKSKKTKTVYLSDDEIAFFEQLTNERKPDEFMFLRSDGGQWLKDHQRERMKDARVAAKITKEITFHNLRHTFGSLLAMSGTRRELLQSQLGHSSPRMTDRYTHFDQTFEQETIRKNKPSFLAKRGKVVEMVKTA